MIKCKHTPCGKEFEPVRKDNTSFCNIKCKNNYYVDLNRRNTKTKIVALLGGKCKRCGWNEHQAGLHPHHIDPSTKSFRIGDGNTRSWEATKAEASKCILLCANCHAVIHVTKDTLYLLG